MKFRTDKYILRPMSISIGMVIAGILLSYLMPSLFFVGFCLIIAGTILSVTGVYVATKPVEYFMPDERTNKNTDRAGHHAFWIMANVVIILGLIDRFTSVSIEYKHASTLIIFIGIYSFLILRWFYNKKGDVE
ncbi:MAG: hypothetical protein GQ469_05985 [Methanosarcinales archaeon]|nr:hypothetical protein [Methanosarcinales archaeon]